MGRTRTFDETVVVARCADVFLRTGYEGTSLDDLVAATGLHRGSLYAAFASKRGIFLAALRQAAEDPSSERTLDLVLVALLELAPRDAEVRTLSDGILERLPGGDAARILGARLIDRAHPNNHEGEQP